MQFPKEITWIKKLLDLSIEQKIYTKINEESARGGLQVVLDKPLTALLDPTQYENFITLVIIPFVRLVTEFHNSIFTKDDKYDNYGVASLNQSLTIIRKLVMSDNKIRDVFVTHAFVGILSIILEPKTSVWCAKGLLNCLGFCLGLVGPDIKEILRQSKDLQFNAAKLLVLIPCKGDYEVQQLVIEFLYKLFGAKLVPLSQKFCCYTNLIEEMFVTEVNDNNLLEKSREFLNKLNGPKGDKVVSILTKELFCGQVPVNAPKVLSKFGGIFINFNLETKTVSFLIVRPNEKFTELSEEEDTVLLTIMENNVKKLDVEYINTKITLIFSLKNPIINFVTLNIKNQNIVQMVFSKYESNATHLVQNVLPQIVDTEIIKTHQIYNTIKKSAAYSQKESLRKTKPLDSTLNNRSMVMSHVSYWTDCQSVSLSCTCGGTTSNNLLSAINHNNALQIIKVAAQFLPDLPIPAETQVPKPKIRAVTETSLIVIEDSELEQSIIFVTDDNFSLEQKPELKKSQNAAKAKNGLELKIRAVTETSPIVIEDSDTESDNLSLEAQIGANEPDSEEKRLEEAANLVVDDDVIEATPQKSQETKKNGILQNPAEKPKKPTKPKEKSVETLKNNSQDKMDPKKDRKKQSESPYSQETVFNGNCPSDDLEIQKANGDKTTSKNGYEKDPEDNKSNSEIINPKNKCPSDDLEAKNSTKDSTKQLGSTLCDQSDAVSEDSFGQNYEETVIFINRNKNEMLIKSSEINDLVEQNNISSDKDVVEKSFEEVVPGNKSVIKSNKKPKKKDNNKKSDLSKKESQNNLNVEKQTNSENIPLSQLLSNIVGQKSQEVGLAKEQNAYLLDVLQNAPSSSKNNAESSQILKNNEIDIIDKSFTNKTLEEEFNNISKLNLPRTRSQNKIIKNKSTLKEHQKQFQKGILGENNTSSDEEDNDSFAAFSKGFSKNNFKNSKSPIQTKKGSNSQKTFKNPIGPPPTPVFSVTKAQTKISETEKIDNNNSGSSNSSASESEVSNNASRRRRRKLHSPTNLSYLQTLAPIIERENTKIASNLVDDNQNKATVKESDTKQSKYDVSKKPEKKLPEEIKTSSKESKEHTIRNPKIKLTKPCGECGNLCTTTMSPIDVFPLSSTPIAYPNFPKGKPNKRKPAPKKVKSLEFSSSSDEDMAQGHVSPEPRSNEGLNYIVKKIANTQAKVLCAAMSNADDSESIHKIVDKLDSFANKINKS